MLICVARADQAPLHRRPRSCTPSTRRCERYLKDFGRLDEKPPDAVVLWEQFLIFAVVFGIADKVDQGR